MKRIVMVWFCVAVEVHAGNVDWTQESRGRETQQIELWSQKLAEAKGMNVDQKMDQLRLGLVNMNHRMTMDDRNPQIDLLYLGIQKELISMPGHAEHQKKIIDDALSTLESLPKDYKLSFLCGYRRTQVDVFKTLALMPSPETVRVLGDFLSDERGGLNYKEGDPLPNETELTCYQYENCRAAATALYALIDDPLSKRKLTDANRSDQYQDWKLWYNQIKAGTKAIRFKGDPNEYDLNGIVREARNPDIPRVTKRPEAETLSPSDQQSTTHGSSWIAGLIAAVFAIGGWLFLRRKQAS